MSTIVIGDIHGRLPPLRGLIATIAPGLRAGDTVVFLGDIIDRGSDSRQCVDQILALRHSTPATVVALRGNHEAWMLESKRDATQHEWLLATDAMATIESYSPAAAKTIQLAWDAAGPRLERERIPLPYEAFFEAMPQEHLAFFEAMPFYWRTADAVCTHGGIDLDGGPPEQQPQEALIWGTAGFQRHYRGESVLVYGHWNNARWQPDGRVLPLQIGRTIGIDASRELTLLAVRLPEREVVQSDGGCTLTYVLPDAEPVS